MRMAAGAKALPLTWSQNTPEQAYPLRRPKRRGDKNYDKIIQKACDFLVSTQKEDGTWDEPYYTGTGFPGYGLGAKVDLRNGAPLPQGKELARGFMLNYNWYRHYFPLTSLGRAEKYFENRK